MGVDLDAGGDADQHPGGRRRSRSVGGNAQPLDPVDLVERIDNDPAHAGGHGRGQLVVALVVAVEHEALRRHAGGESHMELARGRDVEGHALIVGQPGHGPTEEGLGGVGHAVSPGLDRLAAASPQVRLVVDEERGAELLGRIDEVHGPDRQPVPLVNRGSHGQKTVLDRSGGSFCGQRYGRDRHAGEDEVFARRRGHIDSGAKAAASLPPPIDRPVDMVVRPTSAARSRINMVQRG